MQESPIYTLHKLIFTLDRAADKMLQEEFGISHKRALFLVVLHNKEDMTQHELATALGYTDPAVSAMLIPLVKDGYVTVAPSPEHKRKNSITLTPKGKTLVVQAQTMLDGKFENLLQSAAVDGVQYGHMTEQIYKALIKELR